jgi:hypothetical protein
VGTQGSGHALQTWSIAAWTLNAENNILASITGGIYIVTGTAVNSGEFSGKLFFLPSGNTRYNSFASNTHFGIAIADQAADGTPMTDATTFRAIATTPSG